jgi:hypothetical protein
VGKVKNIGENIVMVTSGSHIDNRSFLSVIMENKDQFGNETMLIGNSIFN